MKEILRLLIAIIVVLLIGLVAGRNKVHFIEITHDAVGGKI